MSEAARPQSNILLASVLVLLLAFATTNSMALTTCPTANFRILFEPESSQLDGEDIELIAAGVARMRQCNIDALELIAEGDLESETSLDAQRVSAVRDALVERDVRPDLIHAENLSRETYGQRTSPDPDSVIVMVYFD
jgi:hypothetical protein